LEEPVETTIDPAWTAKGAVAEMLINISFPGNRGDPDKNNTWPKSPDTQQKPDLVAKVVSPL
jgi:hypothetical protein